jgi:uncharacterized coiled-coil DUF342 family protein
LGICRLLKEHLEKLQLTAEQMGKVKSELSVTFSGLLDDLNSRAQNRKREILEYQNNIESLKNTGKACFKRKYVSLTIRVL